jgi:hypothetical protein
MFGPAGNLCNCPEIIITGISTSITAANGIANQLINSDLNLLSTNDLRSIYLQNIYKGKMYTQFKKDWMDRSKDSIYESSFSTLFEIIEGARKESNNINIMVTQMTLHGIATFYDKRHDRNTWHSPSNAVFKNEISKNLYKEYFVDKVLIAKFLENKNAKYLFVMGNDAYTMLKRTFKNDRNLSSLNNKRVQFIDVIEDDFKMVNFSLDPDMKYIIKIKHAAA